MSVQGIAFNPMFEIIRKKDYEDVLTPYNITILAMIKGYFDVRGMVLKSFDIYFVNRTP